VTTLAGADLAGTLHLAAGGAGRFEHRAATTPTSRDPVELCASRRCNAISPRAAAPRRRLASTDARARRRHRSASQGNWKDPRSFERAASASGRLAEPGDAEAYDERVGTRPPDLPRAHLAGASGIDPWARRERRSGA
jgi:hypothetical protein